MPNLRSLRGLAAAFLFASAILHLIAPFVSHYSGDGVPLVAAAGICLGLGAFVRTARRLGTWIVFVVALLLTLYLFGAEGMGSVPDRLIQVALIAQCGAILMLFILLWRDPPKRY